MKWRPLDIDDVLIVMLAVMLALVVVLTVPTALLVYRAMFSCGHVAC